MNNTKGFLLGENGVQLIIAVVASILIVMVGVAVYQSFVPDRATENGYKTLQELGLRLEALSEDKPTGTYLALNVPKTYLFSMQNGDLCGGNFCLCMCDADECVALVENSRVQDPLCVPTSKFPAFLITARTEHGILSVTDEQLHSRAFQRTFGETSANLKLEYVPGKVYQYNVYHKEALIRGDIRYDDFYFWANYFRFGNEGWEFSRDMNQWVAVKDSLRGPAYSEFNTLLQTLEGRNEEDGRQVFNALNIRETNGVYVISL